MRTTAAERSIARSERESRREERQAKQAFAAAAAGSYRKAVDKTWKWTMDSGMSRTDGESQNK